MGIHAEGMLHLKGPACLMAMLTGVCGLLTLHPLPAAEHDVSAVIVKTLAPKSIDGDDADWADVKAEQTINGAAGDAARFKLAYDEKNLYALVVVNADGPLKNSSNILQEVLKGGGALGFCFGPAGGKGANQRILVTEVAGAHVAVAMRPQWPDKSHPYSYHTEAAGTVKMDFVAPLAEVQSAVKTREGGYAAEVKIPWSVLGYGPVDSLEFPFDIQVIFSNPAGTVNTDTRWWHSTGNGPTSTMDIATEAKLYPDVWGRAKLYTKDPGPRKAARVLDDENDVFNGPGVPISFELPRNTKVSLIITEERNGWIVRELLRARAFTKGKHTVYWNGRDRTGQPMPPGEYTYRIGYFDGIKAHFYGSVGNSGRPVYRTADGSGSCGGTHGGPSAVGAGTDGIYMLSSCEEGQKCLRKVDPATGKAKWWASVGVFNNGYAVTEDGAFAYMVYGKQDGEKRLSRMDAATGQNKPIGGKNPVSLGNIFVQGLAVAGDKAFFTEPGKGRIGVVNLQNGAFEKDISVPTPSGICKLDAATLLVCSEKQILKVNFAAGQATPLISNLAAPRAVAVDKQGRIYIADLGASQQIKQFSPDGKLLAAFGKEGGRGATALQYNPLEFRDPAGLAFGPDGNLWLVEQSPPRRFAKLTTQGKWLEDFYGPTGYATVGVDMDDFSQVYYQTLQPSPEYVKTTIDYTEYAKRPGDPVGTWKVDALFNMTQNGVDRGATPDLMSETAISSYGRALIFTGASGKRYFFKPAGQSFALWVWEDGRWKSAAALRRIKKDAGESWALWADTNGDGLVQDGEVTSKFPFMGTFTWIDRDLTLHGQNGDWKPASVNARGVPLYDGGAFTAVFSPEARPLSFYLDQENYGIITAPPSADGTRYYVSNIGPGQGRGFWDRASETRLLQVKNGTVHWMIGHHDARLAHDGDNQMLMNFAGELDGVVMTSEVNANFTAYSTDGLTLGWVATNQKGGMATDDGPTAWYVENVQAGLFLKDPKTGKHLLFGASTEDVRVLEISGVFGDEITRVDGKLALPSAWPRSEQVPGQHTIPYSTWALTEGARYISVEGYDWEWAKDLPGAALYDGKALVADVRLRRDSGNLCIFAEILGPAAFPEETAVKENAGVFGAAPGLEVLIGPYLPDGRATPGAGDTRIFLTAKRNKDKFSGVALICKPASEPLSASPVLRPLNNLGELIGNPPTEAKLDFSKGLMPAPGVVVAVRERFDNHGYRLEAEIPLALLPECARAAPVQIKRQKEVKKIETRLDAPGPLRFNVALWQKAAGAPQRIPWVNDGFTGSDPRAMNPSAWGMANAQAP